MSDITYENKKSHSLRTFIILALAITLTCVSLAMITEASWERSGSLMEAVIMSFLAGGVALSAHLLPALTKKRVGKFGWGIVSAIWMVAVLVTLYSHTIFFVSTMTEAGNARANKSSQVQDIKSLSDENKKLMINTDARSVVAISRDIANIDIQINQLTPRACANCKRIKGNIAGLQAKKDALNIEMDEAKRVASLRDDAIKMDKQAAEVKNNARLDPVTEKLVGIFNGMNVSGVTLLISVVNAALLEMLASLFWWLVWPDKKVEDNNSKNRIIDKKRRPEDIFIDSNEKKLLTQEKDKPLSIENKVKKITADINHIIYNDLLFERKNEDIFIDPYVSKIHPIYKENDLRKVNPKFIEEDINVVSFVKNINIKYKNIEQSIKEDIIDIKNFEEKEKVIDNFDSFFNDSFMENKDKGANVYEDSENYIDNQEIEKNKETVIENTQVNKENEYEQEEIMLEEEEEENQNEIINNDVNEENVEEEKIYLEEDKKTANSDIVYVRPRIKNSEKIAFEKEILKTSNNLSSESLLKEEEEPKEVYKLERIVPHFGSDKMDTDLKKITQQFSKKENEASEDISFEIPVLVNDNNDNESKSLYVNRRKNSSQENVVPNDILKDLFPEVDFVNELSK